MSSIFPDNEVMRVEIYYRKRNKQTKKQKKKTKKQTLTSDSSTESSNILKDSYTQIKWSLSRVQGVFNMYKVIKVIHNIKNC